MLPGQDSELGTRALKLVADDCGGMYISGEFCSVHTELKYF